MTRRRFLLSLAAEPRPNIVLILTDDLGYADLGCFGSHDIRTPAIDGLAREGVRFTNCYSNAPVCSPTRAALMTGRYQQRFGIEYVFYGARTEGKGLSPAEPTLPRMLKSAGYETGMVGKWHLGAEDEFSPNRHGFDEFFGLRNSDHDYYSHRNLDGAPDLWDNENPVRREGYSTDLFGERAVEFIRRRRSSPFFLYAAFNAPHWPFQPPGKPGDVRTQKTWQTGDRAGYIQMVESLDRSVGRILSALDRNTLVIFTNDNGGERLSDNGPNFHHKFTLWEGGIHVPAIVRWPGKVPAGTTSPRITMTMDFTATVLAAAGVKPTRPLDGLDLLQPDRQRALCWRYQHDPIRQKAVRKGEWKLMQDAGYDLLFNLHEDPGERTDLAWRHPEKVAELKKDLAAWEAEMEASKPPWVVR
jgi:arylsulfatase A-like enzyme